MNQNPSFRDVEKLSAYLDGQLKPSEIASLEARLQSDPEFASILEDLRQARGILRQLPQRRAPRNFTLTPKMVGGKPPMPRTYPVFRLASVVATLLLFFTFATNFMAPRLTQSASSVPYGIGGGGGGAAEPEFEMESATQGLAEPTEEPPSESTFGAELATEEAIAPEESSTPAEEALEDTVKPAMEAPMAPEEAATPPTLAEGDTTANDGARAQPTIQPNGFEKSAPGKVYTQDVTPEPEFTVQEKSVPRPVGVTLQILLAGIAILSAIVAFTLRYITIHKWRTKAR